MKPRIFWSILSQRWVCLSYRLAVYGVRGEGGTPSEAYWNWRQAAEFTK